MERTPNNTKSILSCRRNSSSNTSSKNDDFATTSCVNSTPIQLSRNPTEEDAEDSPYFTFTQEGNEDIDVVWDWNSPQAKHKTRKPKKRLNILHSPKVPIKRHHSNTQIQTFEKLKEELQALRNEIAIPDHEESLVLSPQEEERYKKEEVQTPLEEKHIFPCENELDDLFNDSIDQELLLCSQQVEALLNSKKPLFGNNIEPLKTDCTNTIPNKFSNTPQINKGLKISPNKNSNIPQINKGLRINEEEILDDSLTAALSQFKDDLDLTQVIDIKSCPNPPTNRSNQPMQGKEIKTCPNLTATKINQSLVFPRQKSENNYYNNNKMSTGKVEFHRTQSFEIMSSYTEGILPKHVLDEIDRKKREAKAKLDLKKKQEITKDSPFKCSPEEIEKKRLQALAKLEAKKQQDIIEKKRQEALQRLQSRKKNATVKSSLAKRL